MAPNAADIPVPGVVAQDSKTVGDENFSPRKVEPEVVQDSVAAQVAQPRSAENDTVNVHEVVVHLDQVITDPSDPLAVQVPDAGRSPLLTQGLPIAALDSQTVEDQFSDSASEPEEVSEEDAAAARTDEPVNDRS